MGKAEFEFTEATAKEATADATDAATRAWTLSTGDIVTLSAIDVATCAAGHAEIHSPIADATYAATRRATDTALLEVTEEATDA